MGPAKNSYLEGIPMETVVSSSPPPETSCAGTTDVWTRMINTPIRKMGDFLLIWFPLKEKRPDGKAGFRNQAPFPSIPSRKGRGARRKFNTGV
jgi:hypothetical protein